MVGPSRPKAQSSQSSLQNAQSSKQQRNQSQSQHGSLEKHQQKKKKLSNELQNLQNGLQSLAKPKTNRNGSENVVVSQQTTQSSGRQQKTYKVNGVLACNKAVGKGGGQGLPPSKSLGIIDDTLGMKMNNANSAINGILKKQITSPNGSYSGLNGVVSQEDSQSYIIHKSGSVSSVAKK